ncbi:hypothetical protein F4801DRAFT_592320 [Xylaria longipes]|nr:hypothetical protein F4801DRAFT_592320 [Xylaria longipes]
MYEQAPPLDPARVGEDRGVLTTAAITTVAAISTLFAVARLWVRVKIMRKFQFDDYMIVISVICSWMSVGFSTAAVHSGSGRHIQTLTTEQIRRAILFTLIGLVPGILSFVLPKLAVAKLLCRLLNPSRPHRIWLWSICGFNLLALLGSIGLIFGQCQPSNSQWDFSVPARFCWAAPHTVNGCPAFSAFVDLYLAVYPGVVLYKIKLPTRKKIALSLALGIGEVPLNLTDDNCTLTIWTITPHGCSADFLNSVEGSVITIAACIPFLQPLLERVRNRCWSTKGTSKSTDPTSGGRKGHADIELFENKSRIRKFRRKFEMDSILATKNNDEGARVTQIPVRSQDLILEEDKTRLVTTNGGLQNDSNSTPPKTYQGIYRTDEIHISYARDEESSTRPHRHHDSWS